MATTIKIRKWKWFGHTLRKPESNTTGHALDWNPRGARRRGRPRNSWRRTTMDELEKSDITWREAKRKSWDHVVWRQTVEAYGVKRIKARLRHLLCKVRTNVPSIKNELTTYLHYQCSCLLAVLCFIFVALFLWSQLNPACSNSLFLSKDAD